MDSSVKTSRFSFLVSSVWRIQLAAVIVLGLWPVSYGITRLALALLFVSIWATGFYLFKTFRVFRVGSAIVAVVGFLVLVWPERPADPRKIREQYVRALKRYEGTRYVWGGQNSLGIDCSGLVRRALIDANVVCGLSAGNLSLLRQSIKMWWFDASARAMLEEYRGETRTLFSAENIKTLDHTRLAEGDFAVTRDGVHTLAYLGRQKWIEADPGLKKVVILDASDSNLWLNRPVFVMRWGCLK